jgi:hypothetical protein
MAFPVPSRSLGFLVTAAVWNSDVADNINATIQQGVFGTQSISSGGTGLNQLAIRNTSAGTTNAATLALGNDATANAGGLTVTSSTYTAGSNVPQDGMALIGQRAGGVNVSASHASGALRLYTGGSTTARMDITAAGLILTSIGVANAAFIAPAQLVADTHNYNPAGLSTTRTLVVTTDASRNLTGLQAQAEGFELRLYNAGAFNLVLVHVSGSSSAANQFHCPGGANFTLNTEDIVRLFYYSSAWRVEAF